MYTIHQPEKSIFSLMLWEPFTSLYANINIISLLISWLMAKAIVDGADEAEGSATMFLKINIYSIFTQFIIMIFYLPIRLI